MREGLVRGFGRGLPRVRHSPRPFPHPVLHHPPIVPGPAGDRLPGQPCGAPAAGSLLSRAGRDALRVHPGLAHPALVLRPRAARCRAFPVPDPGRRGFRPAPAPRGGPRVRPSPPLPGPGPAAGPVPGGLQLRIRQRREVFPRAPGPRSPVPRSPRADGLGLRRGETPHLLRGHAHDHHSRARVPYGRERGRDHPASRGGGPGPHRRLFRGAPLSGSEGDRRREGAPPEPCPRRDPCRRHRLRRHPAGQAHRLRPLPRHPLRGQGPRGLPPLFPQRLRSLFLRHPHPLPGSGGDGVALRVQ